MQRPSVSHHRQRPASAPVALNELPLLTDDATGASSLAVDVVHHACPRDWIDPGLSPGKRLLEYDLPDIAPALALAASERNGSLRSSPADRQGDHGAMPLIPLEKS